MNRPLFILILCSFAFGGCTNKQTTALDEEAEQRRIAKSKRLAQEHEQNLKDIQTRYPTRKPTAAERQAADRARDKYREHLRRSVVELDDGVSSARKIARAAVGQNLDLLRAKIRAELAHLDSPDQQDSVFKRIDDIPTGFDINDATTMVLKVRKEVGLNPRDEGRARWNSED